MYQGTVNTVTRILSLRVEDGAVDPSPVTHPFEEPFSHPFNPGSRLLFLEVSTWMSFPSEYRIRIHSWVLKQPRYFGFRVSDQWAEKSYCFSRSNQHD